MYGISKNELDSRILGSNVNTTEDSVDNIIKKYTRPGRHITPSSNNNTTNDHKFFPILENCDNTLQNQCNQNALTNENYSLNRNWYDFITKYCREEIKKEIRSKLSENNLQDSFDNKRYQNHTEPSTSPKECSDKATYCRPLLNLYNQEFIYKTIEKNSRLTRLVKKLATAQHRQMQNEAWNNFINELKNKHAHSNVLRRPTQTTHTIPIETGQFHDDDHFSELIDDCYSTKYLFKHSNLCKNLLEDIYKDLYESQVDQKYNRKLKENKYRRDTFCYPTSSLGRLVMMQKEKERLARINIFGAHSTNTITSNEITKNIQNKKHLESFPLHEQRESNPSKSFKNTITQTEKDEYLLNDSTKKIDCCTEIKLDADSENIYISNQSVAQPHNAIKDLSLRHIENKLETVIESINSFIKELKPKRKSRSNRHKTSINMISKECHNVRTEILKNYNGDVLLDAEKYNSSDSILPINNNIAFLEQYTDNNSDITKLNEMFTKELGVDTYNRNKTCAVQIAFEVPTKERSTEVTKSLSQTWKKNSEDKIEEIVVPVDIHENNQMTIAVNTDPLSFLALLRISTEAVKRLISYMPNFDYYYYLSRLQFPQLPKSVERQYICNICGANFKKPSDLNDHIQEHDLGETRNCCVCRHVLENLGRTSCLFSCRYCGQCFTRAYCCELHQETCAKRLGKQHDENSDLLLLR